jgi:hypothetical protein
MSDYEDYETINTEDLTKVITEIESNVKPKIKAEVESKSKAESKTESKAESKSEHNIKFNINSIPEHDAWADHAIFFPLANKLKNPLNNLELSPILITVTGSLLRVLAMYYIYKNEPYYAAGAYLVAYIFDSIDEKSSDKFEERTVFSFITNLILGTILIYKYELNNYYKVIILILMIMLILNYGLEEAIICNMINGNDNFLLRRQKEIGDSDNLIDKIFLAITNISYIFYKTIFPTFNKNKINKLSPIIKEFGPGNFTLAMTFIIFNL